MVRGARAIDPCLSWRIQELEREKEEDFDTEGSVVGKGVRAFFILALNLAVFSVTGSSSWWG